MRRCSAFWLTRSRNGVRSQWQRRKVSNGTKRALLARLKNAANSSVDAVICQLRLLRDLLESFEMTPCLYRALLRTHSVWTICSSFGCVHTATQRAVAAFISLPWRLFYVNWRLYRIPSPLLVRCQPDQENPSNGWCTISSDVVLLNLMWITMWKVAFANIPGPLTDCRWNSCHFVPRFSHVFYISTK